mgnify:CR=1 FL=1
MFCKYCGYEYQNENVRFCPKCGRSIENEVVIVENVDPELKVYSMILNHYLIHKYKYLIHI